MKLDRFLLISTLTSLVAGCGGHGAYSPSNSTTSSGSSTTYNFVEPKVNSQRNYTNTIVDNKNNNIPDTFVATVSAVNADGSYVIQQQDQSSSSVIVNGISYAVPTETENFNDSGQETSYTYTPSGGVLTTCSVSPHGAGPNYPLAIGDTWSTSYNITCGSDTPINYMQTGSAVDVETVTVPAGTYNTLKLQSTLTWTDANGTSYSKAITDWLDIDTSVLVQEKTTTTPSGTKPVNGYAASTDLVLQSLL